MSVPSRVKSFASGLWPRRPGFSQDTPWGGGTDRLGSQGWGGQWGRLVGGGHPLSWDVFVRQLGCRRNAQHTTP